MPAAAATYYLTPSDMHLMDIIISMGVGRARSLLHDVIAAIRGA